MNKMKKKIELVHWCIGASEHRDTSALIHHRLVHKTYPLSLFYILELWKIILGGWRLTYRIETDIPMDGIQRNRMDRCID